MEKFNPSKNVIITLVVVIIVVIILGVAAAQRTNEGKLNFFQSTTDDSVAMIDRTISAPVRWIRNGIDSVHSLFSTYAENERLKEKVDSYNDTVQQSKSYGKEIESLKKELDLSQMLTNYGRVTASVITRSLDGWQDMLVADKGSKDGIEASITVMLQRGSIGRVIEINTVLSKIELLLSSDESFSHFPVRVPSTSGEASGLLKNYNEELHALMVTQLIGDTDIEEGDVIQTSGLGGDSPANLPVSMVIKAKPDGYGLDREVYVEPYAKIYGVSVVTVVQRLVEDQFVLKKGTVKYCPPITLFLLMSLDGHLTRMLGEWSKGGYMSDAHFLVLALLCCSMESEKHYLLITTIVLGAAYDAYYIGIIGIYAVVLPLIVWPMYVMKNVIHTNIFTEFFNIIIFVTGYELFTMAAQLIFKLAVVSNTHFIARLLGPTLLLNMITFVLFVFPFKKLFSDE